jgi:hypothetical protein
VAETLDWAMALVALGAPRLTHDLMAETKGCFLKDETDIRAFEAELETGRSEMISNIPAQQME